MCIPSGGSRGDPLLHLSQLLDVGTILGSGFSLHLQSQKNTILVSSLTFAFVLMYSLPDSDPSPPSNMDYFDSTGPTQIIQDNLWIMFGIFFFF